ncbi:MAG: LemA family protein [Candidatus Anstonellaceae archaeon]
MGAVKPYNELKISPYLQKKCVIYQTKIYRLKKEKWNKLLTLSSKDPIFVEDETGEVLVQPWNKDFKDEFNHGVRIKKDVKLMYLSVENKNKGFIQKFINKMKSFFNGISNRIFGKQIFGELELTYEKINIIDENEKRKTREFLERVSPFPIGDKDIIKIEESYVEAGEKIYVIGNARMDEKGQMIIEEGKNRFFWLSDTEEKKAKEQTRFIAQIYGLIGSLLLISGIAIFLMSIALTIELTLPPDIFQEFLLILLIVLILMNLVFFVVDILELYNGTVRLFQNIQKAKANLDTLLQMRSELIPKLLEVVVMATKHEKDIQAEISKIRTMQIQQMNKTLNAFLENYPALQSNQNYLLLQKQLASLQEKIAGLQTYLVDSITLYNTRVQSFPYLLFAPLVGFKPLPIPKFFENQ